MIARITRAVLASLVLCLVALPGVAMAAHPNDEPEQARVIGLDENEIVDNTGATTSTGEPLTETGPGYCNAGEYSPSSGVDMVSTIWWEVTGNDYPVTIDLRGSAINTVVAVYEGTPSTASLVACNDNISGGDQDSEALFNTDPGQTYYVQVGCASTCADPEGAIDFIAWSSPPGDFRSEALELRPGTAAPGDTRGATEEAGENLDCGDVPFSRTVWYRYNAPGFGTATFSAGGTFDSVIAVYRDSTLIGCSDDPSSVQRAVVPGVYHVQVSAIGIAPNAEYGTFQATVDFIPRPIDRDPDRDGVLTPNDRCPTENASGRDANRDGCLDPIPDLDRDDDGVNDDLDCDDDNPAVNQRAKEILGNSVDEDCVGGPQDFPRLSVNYEWDARWARSTRFRELRFNRVPAGTTVSIRCRGRGCGRKRITRRFPKGRGRVDFARSMRRMRPRPRSVVEVRLTKKDHIGQVVRFTIRLNKKPKRQRLCLRPGARRATSCG